MSGMAPVRPHPSPALRFVLESLRHAPVTLFLSALTVAAAAIYTRLFLPAQYGTYSLVLAVTAPLITVLTEWAAQPIGRFYAEYTRRDGGHSLSTVVSNLCGVFLFIVPPIGAALWLLLRLLGLHPAPDIYFGGLLVVALQSSLSVTTPIFTASLRAHLLRRASVGASTGAVFIGLTLLWMFGQHIALLLWGHALALALVVPLALRWAGLRPRLPRLGPAELAIIRRLWQYGWPMAAWFFSASVLDLQDRYVIQHFRGPAEVGLYAVSYSLAAGIGGLLNIPVSVASGPILFQHWAAGQVTEARQLLRRMTSLYLLFGFGVLGLVHLLGPALFAILLGTRFHAGVAVLTPVLLGRLLWGLSVLGQKSLELAERTRLLLLNAVLAAVLNLVLNLLLVPRWGYIAAAYTTTLSFAAYAGLTWWQARRVLPWTIEWRPALAGSGGAVLAVALSGLASSWLGPPERLVHALLGGVVYCLIYAGLQVLVNRPLLLELRRPTSTAPTHSAVHVGDSPIKPTASDPSNTTGAP